jgi:hypothetical protein
MEAQRMEMVLFGTPGGIGQGVMEAGEYRGINEIGILRVDREADGALKDAQGLNPG